MKKQTLKIIVSLLFLLLLLMPTYSYAGQLVNISGENFYYTDQGNVAKNVWVWIDENNDGIEECYRFDENGFLVKNYVHYDGKKTNEAGQLLLDGVVVRKMTATGRVIIDNEKIFSQKVSEEENLVDNSILIPDSISEKTKEEIKKSWYLGSETLSNDETIDGQIINNTKVKSKNIIDVVPESGVIYSESVNEDIAVDKNGEIIPGKNAAKFISSSHKFDKDVKKATIYNGDIWENCMALNGNNSKVKFSLNKYNYLYFEISNENHTNEIFRRNLDAVLSIYVDNKLFEEIDDFTDGEPQIVELDLDGALTLELRLKVRKGDISERVYIHNARFRKIKNED